MVCHIKALWKTPITADNPGFMMNEMAAEGPEAANESGFFF